MSDQLSVSQVELYGNKILLRWNDGHESTFGARELRISCQCAECVEEWSNRKLLDPATVAADIRAEDYLSVGRYAVQFLWSDEHFTGIYNHENKLWSLIQFNLWYSKYVD